MAGIIKDGKTYASVNPSEYVSKSRIAKTIDENSTNEEVAGAKAVNDIMTSQKVNMGSYMGDLNDIPYIDNNKVFIYKVWSTETSNKPVNTHGTVYHIWYNSDFKYATQLFIGILGVIYIRNKNNGTWSVWRKICTTSINDVGVKDIEIDTNYINSPNCKYQVKNGVCYIDFMSGTYKISSNLNGAVIATGLPIPNTGQCCTTYVPWSSGDATKQVILFINNTGEIILHCSMSANNCPIFCSFSYPVKET